MAANVWPDRANGALTYNIEDARYPVLGKGAGVDKKTEVDHTQKTARSNARGAALGAVGGAIGGDASRGSAIGAGVGAASGLIRRGRARRQREAVSRDAEAKYQASLQNYYRAFSACMNGRGYTVS